MNWLKQCIRRWLGVDGTILVRPATVQLRDGDIAVLQVPSRISREAAERIRQAWEREVNTARTKCLVLDEGMKLAAVLTPAQKSHAEQLSEAVAAIDAQMSGTITFQ